MSRPVYPEDILDRLIKAERKIADLERTATNARQGQNYLDAAGVVRVRIGPIPSGGHGIATYDALGNPSWSQTTP